VVQEEVQNTVPSSPDDAIDSDVESFHFGSDSERHIPIRFLLVEQHILRKLYVPTTYLNEEHLRLPERRTPATYLNEEHL
jgi:hypothetical protein